eukprot:CAMPEP_0168725384 /NCGR_PEP_ID=MMETSP0724-20121128/4126_1 /TAXON_ID=265536 /ORGANISM="Amphiprora sp., Strain CCMP467" /LENGTH=595 /DNA_ID=CAMNT_0008772167 /DNA_START=31 /DNA_END=1819 /DNA_ORIENTATION=+
MSTRSQPSSYSSSSSSVSTKIASSAAVDTTKKRKETENGSFESRKKSKKQPGKPKDDRNYEDPEEEAPAEFQGNADSSKEHSNSNTIDGDLVASMDSVFGNLDIINLVSSFLHVRELYNLVLTSKRYMENLEYDPIVRSALLSGNTTRTSMEKLVPLLQQKFIWSLSPMDLLRLMNATKCRCCRHPLNMKGPGSVHKAFGLVYCSSEKRVGMARVMVRTAKWNGFLDHPRVSVSGAGPGRANVFVRPFQDPHTKAPYGPFLTREHMFQFFRDHDRKAASDEKKAEYLDQLLEEMDRLDPLAERRAQAISQAYERWSGVVVQRVEEKNAVIQQHKDEMIAKHKERVQSSLNVLIEFIGDGPWKVALSQHSFNDCGEVEFECPFLTGMLDELNRAPSRARTKKILATTTQRLKESFNLIRQHNYHDLSFLAKGKTRYEKVLWSYFRTRVESLNPEFSVSSDALSKLELEQPLKALECDFTAHIVIAVVESLMEKITIQDPSPEKVEASMTLAKEFFRMNLECCEDHGKAFKQCWTKFVKLYDKCVEHGMELNPMDSFRTIHDCLCEEDLNSSDARRNCLYRQQEQEALDHASLGELW